MKLVVAYDGSKSSRDALAVAVERARVFPESVVYLVHSMSENVGEDAGRIDEVEQLLDRACSELANKGFACETHLLIRGFQPGEDIVRFATDIQANEVLVGIEKQSRVEKMLLGSTAQYVVLNAPCPVTTVRRIR